MSGENPKAKKMVDAAEACLRLIASQGLGAVTFARVAREAKVSRPWLYKYVGQSKDSLVTFAVDQLGSVMAALGDRPDPRSHAEWLEANRRNTRRLLDLVTEHPAVFHTYYRYRGSPNAVGARILRLEEAYISQVSQEMRRALGIGSERATTLARQLANARPAPPRSEIVID